MGRQQPQGTAGEAERKKRPRQAKRDRPLSRYDEQANDKARKFVRREGSGNDAESKKRFRVPEKTEDQVEKEKRLAQRYHRIKFFDRLKTERKLKAVLLRLKSEPDDRDLLDQKKTLLDDLRYIRFFPRGEKYISLATPDMTDAVRAKQQELRNFALMLSTRSKRGKPTQLMSFMQKVEDKLSKRSTSAPSLKSQADAGEHDSSDAPSERNQDGGVDDAEGGSSDSSKSTESSSDSGSENEADEPAPAAKHAPKKPEPASTEEPATKSALSGKQKTRPKAPQPKKAKGKATKSAGKQEAADPSDVEEDDFFL